MTFSFGASTQPATGGFGAASASTGFGASATPAPAFGAAASQPSTAFGGFGKTTTTAAGGFGGFGAAATTKPATGFGGFGAAATTQSTGFGGFGATTATTATPAFGGFGGAATTSAAPAFGGFGATTAATGFGGFGATTTQQTGFGGFGATTTTTSSTGFGGFGGGGFGAGTGGAFGGGAGTGFSNFGATNTQQPQQQQQPPQPGGGGHDALYQSVMQCSLYNDTRDSIIARLNMLQASWGQGKAYFSNQAQPVAISPDNPLCRFKAVGYSVIPKHDNTDGLVAIVIAKKAAEVEAGKAALVSSLTQVLGNKPGLSVSVEAVKEAGDHSEAIVTVTEAAGGHSRKIPSQDLTNFFTGQAAQLKNLGVQNVYAKVTLHSVPALSIVSCCVTNFNFIDWVFQVRPGGLFV